MRVITKTLADWGFEKRQDEQDIGNPGELNQDRQIVESEIDTSSQCFGTDNLTKTSNTGDARDIRTRKHKRH
jgi:hypothetical protein